MVINMVKVSWIQDMVPVLKDINWQVQPGEHWAIIGLNGSGKTTLLNLINGYIWPSTGHLSVLDHEFGKTDLRVLRQSIGWVSSSLQEKLYPNETALDIVLSGRFATIGLFDKPESSDTDQAFFLLEQLKCGHIAKQRYSTLSQGERQKVLIARALLSTPKLLILDEPCTGLDFFSREQLLSTIEIIAQQDTSPTLLYVTHHVEEILPVFNHVLLLRNGQVFSSGKTGELLTSTNMSGFFGEPVDLIWNNNRAWMRLAKR